MTAQAPARTPHGWHIVAAIALKDALDAMRNHITLGILLGATLLMVSGVGLPRLLAARSPNLAVIYDLGEAGLREAWAARDDLQMVEVDSQAELEQLIGESMRPMLGLVLPPDFASAAAEGGPLIVAGYVAHWLRPDQAARQVGFFETRLSEAAGRPVHVSTVGRAVFPTAQAGGQVALLGMHLATQLLIVGLVLAPYLLVEEKETRTFDALLVSPASYGQVVAGKALAAAAYCLLGAAVILAFIAAWVVHWGLMALAVLLGAAFTVGLGLLGGTLARDGQTVGLAMTTLMLFLLLPVLVGLGPTSSLPAWAQAVLSYWPTAALMGLIRASMAGDLAGAPIGFFVTVLIASALGVYALVIGLVRRARA